MKQTPVFSFGAQVTVGGYRLDEAVSSLQKAIRRSNVESALFWCSELDLSNFGAFAWTRLRVICSEDIGPANPTLPAVLDALYESWEALRRSKSRHHPERLCLMHGCYLLAISPKSRVVDSICTVMYSASRPKVDVEDHALDCHTSRGRSLQRGYRHFLDEAARLEPPSTIPDPFAQRARAILEGATKDLFEL